MPGAKDAMKPYAMERARAAALDLLAPRLPEGVDARVVLPPPGVAADLAVPCFPLAKALRRAPDRIAADLAAAIVPPAGSLIARAEPAGGYLNLHFDWDAFARAVASDI